MSSFPMKASPSRCTAHPPAPSTYVEEAAPPTASSSSSAPVISSHDFSTNSRTVFSYSLLSSMNRRAASALAGELGLGSVSKLCPVSTPTTSSHELQHGTLRARHRETQHNLNGSQDGRYVIDGAPLVLQNVQADGPIVVHCVSPPRDASECHLQRKNNHGNIYTERAHAAHKQRCTVGVEHLGLELDFGGLVGVLIRELQGQAKGPSLPRSPFRTAPCQKRE